MSEQKYEVTLTIAGKQFRALVTAGNEAEASAKALRAVKVSVRKEPTLEELFKELLSL